MVVYVGLPAARIHWFGMRRPHVVERVTGKSHSFYYHFMAIGAVAI